jgi:hypothetical protein
MRPHTDRRGIIGLIVDHPKRDLAGLVLIAHHLASLKLRSALVPMYQQGIDVPLLNASPVLVNYARENNRAILQGYVRQRRSVAVHDAEGGVLSNSGARSPENWARYTRRRLCAIDQSLLLLGPCRSRRLRGESCTAPGEDERDRLRSIRPLQRPMAPHTRRRDRRLYSGEHQFFPGQSLVVLGRSRRQGLVQVGRT